MLFPVIPLAGSFRCPIDFRSVSAEGRGNGTCFLFPEFNRLVRRIYFAASQINTLFGGATILRPAPQSPIRIRWSQLPLSSLEVPGSSMLASRKSIRRRKERRELSESNTSKGAATNGRDAGRGRIAT